MQKLVFDTTPAITLESTRRTIPRSSRPSSSCSTSIPIVFVLDCVLLYDRYFPSAGLPPDQRRRGRDEEESFPLSDHGPHGSHSLRRHLCARQKPCSQGTLWLLIQILRLDYFPIRYFLVSFVLSLTNLFFSSNFGKNPLLISSRHDKRGDIVLELFQLLNFMGLWRAISGNQWIHLRWKGKDSLAAALHGLGGRIGAFIELLYFLQFILLIQALYNTYIQKERRSIVDVLKEHPSCKPDIDHLLELLPRLQVLLQIFNIEESR